MKLICDPLYVEDNVPVRDQTTRPHRVKTMVGMTSTIVDECLQPPSYRSYLLVYDNTGKRMRQQRFSHDGRITQEWQYDDSGALLEEMNYDPAGRLNYRFEFSYKDACWHEKHMLDAQGAMLYRIVAERSSDGSLLKAVFYKAAEQLIRSDTYLYDAAGLLLEVSLGETGKRFFTYDSAGNLSRRSTTLPGASIYGDTDELAYDSRGLLGKMTHLHESETSFEYVFF